MARDELKYVLALNFSFRYCSNIDPWYWLVPRFVMNFRFTPLCAPESAPRPPVSTVTSSIAPRRGGTVPKKLVPPLLNPFDELLMPSIVGLIVPPGIPLKCVPPPTGCTTPGDSRARPNVLRPGSGSSRSASLFNVVEIVFVVASSTGAAPTTVTDSPTG